MTDAVKLEPCPLCRSESVGVIASAHQTLADHRVKCWTCGTEGPKRLVAHEAVKAWNRRAGLEAVRREAMEEGAKAIETLWFAHDAGFALCGDTLDHAAKEIRSLAANPQEGAAEVEGQGAELIGGLIDALNAAAACNDLSFVPADEIEAAARNQLQGVEIICRDAIAAYEKAAPMTAPAVRPSAGDTTDSSALSEGKEEKG